MRFGPGKKTDLLSPEEREIVDRFERGAIDAAEAGRLLIATTQHASEAPVARAADDVDQTETDADPNETPDEAAARRLVEQIAREVYEKDAS